MYAQDEGRAKFETPEDLLTRPEGTLSTASLVEAFGERKTLKAWSEDPRCVISDAHLYRRMNDGWEIEEALTKQIRRIGYEAFGETKTVPEWLKDPRCQVGRATLQNRLAQGWDPEAALTTRLRNREKAANVSEPIGVPS